MGLRLSHPTTWDVTLSLVDGVGTEISCRPPSWWHRELPGVGNPTRPCQRCECPVREKGRHRRKTHGSRGAGGPRAFLPQHLLRVISSDCPNNPTRWMRLFPTFCVGEAKSSSDLSRATQVLGGGGRTQAQQTESVTLPSSWVSCEKQMTSLLCS